jgi:hypothetical protein
VGLGVALALPLLSCGYSFSGSSLPGHVRTIAVPTFTNDTLQPALEREVTAAVVEAFVDDRRLQIAGVGSGDAVVQGTITEYDHSVFGLGGEGSTQEFRVTVRLSVTVKDRVKGRDLWSKDALVGQATYAFPAKPGTLASEDAARAEAVRELAEDILALTLEEW